MRETDRRPTLRVEQASHCRTLIGIAQMRGQICECPSRSSGPDKRKLRLVAQPTRQRTPTRRPPPREPLKCVGSQRRVAQQFFPSVDEWGQTASLVTPPAQRSKNGFAQRP